MADVNRGAAIVGIHEHITRYAPDKSELQLQGESIIKALDDAGLTKKDVDGLLTASMSIRNSGLALADYLDMSPKMVDNTTVGGGSFEFHLSHAMTAIAAARPTFGPVFFTQKCNASHAAISRLHRQGCIINKFHRVERKFSTPFLIYIFWMSASPNSEHLSNVAPSIRRSKSYVTVLLLMVVLMVFTILSAASSQPM